MTGSLSHPAVWTAEKGLGAFTAPFGEISPGEILERLENGPGAVLLRGFPLADRSKDSAREAFLDWCREWGNPVSQSVGGDEVFDVEDAGYGENDSRNRGPNTRKALSFHTDRCDVIGFLCWRQAVSGGENEIVSSMHLYNLIREDRPDLLAALEQTYPYKRHNVDGGNDKLYCEQPVFSFSGGHFACCFLRVLIDRADADPDLPSLTPIQREALDFLEEKAADPRNKIGFLQRPGDVLLLNNWVTLHRRAGFVDHETPAEKRCLFRIWLSVPNSRPLHPAFLDNYGSVEAGVVRGGMRPLPTPEPGD